MALQKRTEKDLRKIRDIYIEIIQRLFVGNRDGKQLSIYENKTKKVGHNKFNLKAQNFVHAALNELKSNFKESEINSKGRISNSKHLGKYFHTLYKILSNNVDVFVIYDKNQINSPDLPLSNSYRAEFLKIIERNEAVALLIIKHPPEKTAHEISRVSEHCLHGLMSLWANEKFQQTSDIRQRLKDYLHHATVRILHTGHDSEVVKITQNINEHLEKHGGFEDTHWLRVVKSIAQDEEKKSLKQALGVCIPIVVIIKIVEHVFPKILHALGGVLDDLFGAIIPDVSQSMGDKHLPFRSRFKKAWPVLKGGLITLPLAFCLGWFSAKIYQTSDSTALHILSGVMFSCACFLGTLGTSIAAFKKAYSDIQKLQEDKEHGYLVAGLNPSEKINLAFKESILDVPFRVGHTLIGIPFQILLGIAAGAFGFFNSTIFIMVEGMAETLLGTITTFAYLRIARLHRNSRLRRTKF
jgi:hypothetical protein